MEFEEKMFLIFNDLQEPALSFGPCVLHKAQSGGRIRRPRSSVGAGASNS